MRPFNRISFICLILHAFSFGSFAGTGHTMPVSIFSDHFFLAVTKANAFLSTELPAKNTGAGAKICSCQILDLSSSNYDHRHIAVLAEKTNNGSSRDYKIAGARIEQEKKQLKRLFYDRVKIVGRSTGHGSCTALYYQLKSADHSLQLYDILNADINR